MSRREASTPLRLVSTLPLMSNNPAPFPPGFTAPETTGATTLLTSLAESRGSKISSVDWVTAVEELCELMNVTDALRKAILSMAGRVHGPRPKLVALPPWGEPTESLRSSCSSKQTSLRTKLRAPSSRSSLRCPPTSRHTSEDRWRNHVQRLRLSVESSLCARLSARWSASARSMCIAAAIARSAAVRVASPSPGEPS